MSFISKLWSSLVPTNTRTSLATSSIYASHYPAHPYHLVTPSPWPALGGLTALCITTGGVSFIHSYSVGTYALPLGQIMMWYVMYVWWRDVIREATFEGLHTTAVQKSHRIGIVLFLSELCSSLLSFEHFSIHQLFRQFKSVTRDLLKGFKPLTHERFLF
jgi:hypothetical protein